MNAKEILTKSRDLIANVGWTQRASARDVTGNAVSPRNPEATCFCMIGALQAVRDGFLAGDPELNRAYKALTDACDGQYPAYFNDARRRTKEEVLARYAVAIASFA